MISNNNRCIDCSKIITGYNINMDNNTLDSKYNKLDEEHTELKYRYNKLENRYNKLEKEHNELKDRYIKLEDRYNKLEDRYNKLEDRYNLLEKEHNELKDKYNKLENKYNEMTMTLSAREIGSKTNNAILDVIFPKCRQKPFFITTMTNMKQLIEDPSFAVKNDNIRKSTFDEWNKMTIECRNGIIERFNKIIEENPDLILSLKLLSGCWHFAHTQFSNIDEAKAYFNEKDQDIGEAINSCYPLFPKTESCI